MRRYRASCRGTAGAVPYAYRLSGCASAGILAVAGAGRCTPGAHAHPIHARLPRGLYPRRTNGGVVHQRRRLGSGRYIAGPRLVFGKRAAPHGPGLFARARHAPLDSDGRLGACAAASSRACVARLADANDATSTSRDTHRGRHAGAVDADAAPCAAAHAAAYHGSRGHVHDADTVALAGTHRSAGPSDAVCVRCLVDRGAVPRSCSTCTGTVRLAEPDAHYVLAVCGACPARLAVDPRLMPRCASFPTRVVVVRLPECACSIGGRDAAVCVVADHDRIAHAPDALASCFLVRTRWLLQRGCTGCACLAPCRDSPSRVGRRARRPHSLVGMAIVRCASP